MQDRYAYAREVLASKPVLYESLSTPLIYVQSDVPEGMTLREWHGLRAPRRTRWQRIRRWLNGR